MNISLFQMALDKIKPSEWEYFEQLCSSFLISEYASMRTMAHPSGDGGRDSELFQPEGRTFISAQYSVTKEWKSKIQYTVKQIKANFPEVRFLIYMSNKQIGGQADQLKRTILDQGISIDIRDKSWFIDRAYTDAVRENATKQFIDRIARPYLEDERIIKKRSSPLTSEEANAALLYLGLQWQDDITNKGLTKLSFDALVRAALRQTNSEKRMTRHEIYKSINEGISSNDNDALHRLIDSALSRLTKKYIRHWKKEDEFCLTHDEHQRILSRLADIENEESEFFENLSSQCSRCLEDFNESNLSDQDDLSQRIPRVIEKLLLRRGESFVNSVLSSSITRVEAKDLNDLIFIDLQDQPPRSNILQHYPGIIQTVIRRILLLPDSATQLYLKRLANSYTLLSFLNQTPNVQNATKKLFSHGTVWVDTTVLLPLLAEQMETNEEREGRGKLTELFNVCSQTGVKFRVTTGIINEVNAHMNNAVQCSKLQPGAWQGRIPFLYSRFLQTGKSPIEFEKWTSLFKGAERPDDDLAQYLMDVFGIERHDLEDEANKVDSEIRWTANRLWTEAHKRRRKVSHDIDEETTRILIQHDLETFLGVILLRSSENVTELGYRHWLLTLDSIAWHIQSDIKNELNKKAPVSPLLSLSFMLNNMIFGPSRSFTSKSNSLSIPLILDIEMSESMPHDLLEVADKIRKENEGLPDYVIRRKVRDALDRARRKKGCLGDLDDMS